MNNYLEPLIFDRTLTDLDNLTSKAFIDYNDLNRVESAIKYVAIQLNKKGYHCNVKSKLNWKMEERRTEVEMQRLQKNLVAIREVYYTPSSTPMTPANISYESIYQANAIEQIIYDLGVLIERAFDGMNHLSFKLGSRSLGNRGV